MSHLISSSRRVIGLVLGLSLDDIFSRLSSITYFRIYTCTLSLSQYIKTLTFTHSYFLINFCLWNEALFLLTTCWSSSLAHRIRKNSHPAFDLINGRLMHKQPPRHLPPFFKVVFYLHSHLFSLWTRWSRYVSDFKDNIINNKWVNWIIRCKVGIQLSQGNECCATHQVLQDGFIKTPTKFNMISWQIFVLFCGAPQAYSNWDLYPWPSRRDDTWMLLYCLNSFWDVIS